MKIGLKHTVIKNITLNNVIMINSSLIDFVQFKKQTP